MNINKIKIFGTKNKLIFIHRLVNFLTHIQLNNTMIYSFRLVPKISLPTTLCNLIECMFK